MVGKHVTTLECNTKHTYFIAEPNPYHIGTLWTVREPMHSKQTSPPTYFKRSGFRIVHCKDVGFLSQSLKPPPTLCERHKFKDFHTCVEGEKIQMKS